MSYLFLYKTSTQANSCKTIISTESKKKFLYNNKKKMYYDYLYTTYTHE